MSIIGRDDGGCLPNLRIGKVPTGRVMVILVGLALLLAYSLVAASLPAAANLAVLAGSTACGLVVEVIRWAIAQRAAGAPQAGPAVGSDPASSGQAG